MSAASEASEASEESEERWRGGREAAAASSPAALVGAARAQAGAGMVARTARARVGACDACGCAGSRCCGAAAYWWFVVWGGGVRGGSVIRVIFCARRVGGAGCNVLRSGEGESRGGECRVVGERCRPSSASHPRSARGGWRRCDAACGVRGWGWGWPSDASGLHSTWRRRGASGGTRGDPVRPRAPDADRAPSDRTMCRWRLL